MHIVTVHVNLGFCRKSHYYLCNVHVHYFWQKTLTTIYEQTICAKITYI